MCGPDLRKKKMDSGDGKKRRKKGDKWRNEDRREKEWTNEEEKKGVRKERRGSAGSPRPVTRPDSNFHLRPLLTARLVPK